MVWYGLHFKFQLPQKSRSFNIIHGPEGWVGCAGYVVGGPGCAGYVVGGRSRHILEPTLAQLSQSVRAECGSRQYMLVVACIAMAMAMI